jgi:hypothetical protein
MTTLESFIANKVAMGSIYTTSLSVGSYNFQMLYLTTYKPNMHDIFFPSGHGTNDSSFQSLNRDRCGWTTTMALGDTKRVHYRFSICLSIAYRDYSGYPALEGQRTRKGQNIYLADSTRMATPRDLRHV